ncbi:MAG TPA: hypothetical protein GX510_03015 [Firmicutes bacterium]|nr:hypothetical protein [Candidatus Fermentithermobacillaceae bacterium]
MKRAVLWKACTAFLLALLLTGFVPEGSQVALAETDAVIRGAVIVPDDAKLVSLWAVVTSTGRSLVYPAAVQDNEWEVEVPAGTYVVEVRWAYTLPIRWQEGSTPQTEPGSQGSVILVPVPGAGYPILENQQEIGPITVAAGATVKLTTRVTKGSPLKLTIEVPERVSVGETFVIKVVRTGTSEPVAGAEVYLLPKRIPWRDAIDPDSKTPGVTIGKLLGKTNAEGELKTSIREPGDYILRAVFPGALPAFAGIIVEESQGLRFFTDKGIYASGEKVILVLYNGSSATITLPSSAPWEVRKADGTLVFAPIALQVIRNLEPGNAVTWEWAQKDNAGKQVPPGVYVAKVQTSQGELEAKFSVSGLRGLRMSPLPLPTLPSESPFEDVTRQVKWGDPFILALYAKGIVKGKAAGKFAPDDTMSRAEFVALLFKAAGIDEGFERGKGKDGKDKEEKDKEDDVRMFPDVRRSHWAYSSIQRALEIGLITKDEYPDGFEPDEPITRMEMAVIAVRAMGLRNEAEQRAGDELPFSDAHKIEWRYRGYIAVAVEAGILSGTDDGRIDPSGLVTRRQAAVVVWRVLSSPD